MRHCDDNDQNHDNEMAQNNANGTCVSIEQWGSNNGLDNEQQIAFELIVRTFVLSFFDNLEQDIIDMTHLMEEGKNLKLLVRNENEMGPMRLFVTGPAGSGKCENWQNDSLCLHKIFNCSHSYR